MTQRSFAVSPLSAAVGHSEWLQAIAILGLAVLIRLALLQGGTGTDEILYIGQAERLLSGDIGHFTYIGSIRYGITFVQAISLALFGRNDVGASGIWFLFSIADIILAYQFARTIWGNRAAIWTGVCLATLPLHVEEAGDWVPDAYLTFVIDVTFVTLYFALRTGSFYVFAAVGALTGLVFWIKEAVILYAGAPALLLALYGRRFANWFAVAAGGLVVMVANFSFFGYFYGDPFYVFHILKAQVESTYVNQNMGDTSALSYVYYLLRWPFYTGYVAFLSGIGGVVLLYRRFLAREDDRAIGSGVYVVVWAAALFWIFSFMPISFSPLRFIGKQPNYMMIFTTPLCLLAGYALASLWRPLRIAIGLFIAFSGIYFSALDQQRWQLFTADGRAAVAFVGAHPEGPVFGSSSIHRQSVLAELLSNEGNRAPRICSVEELGTWASQSDDAGDANARVFIDQQNRVARNYYRCFPKQDPPDFAAVGEQPIELQLTQLPPCWRQVALLEGRPDKFGRFVVGSVRKFLPRGMWSGLLPPAAYWDLPEAAVYSVTRDCVRTTIAK